jgi:TRAP transporter TAXI family solute receptor
LPLKTGRVEFSANGVANYLAQEGVFQFADPQWGPMPLRMLMSANGLFNQAVAVGADLGISTFADLRGRRVSFIRGAPALNVSTEAMLACGGLTWDDVIRVDFPGYDAAWNGLINGDVDAAFGSTVSGPARRLEASPRGIFWPPVPHDDEACWRRLHAVAPYFTRYNATRGPGISDENPHEGGTYPYPVLVALDTQDEELVYWMTKALHQNYDSYKDSDPGAIGWALEYQLFDWVVPYHDGAVRYWREVGAWTEAFEAHNQELLRRQEVLAEAWQEAIAQGIEDTEAFTDSWMRLRAQRLEAAGLEAIWR